MLIVFSGVDGAGKSTQIDCLNKQMLLRGLGTEVIWSRGGYTSGVEFVKKLVRLTLGKKTIPSGRSVRRDKVMSSPLVSRVWLLAALIDLILLYVFIIRFKSLSGSHIICDRYVGDTFIDFSLNFPQVDFEQMWLWKLLVNCSPRPDVGFLFILPEGDSIKRSKLKNEPFPDSLETLKSRIAIYLSSSLFKGQSWMVVDGLESIEATSEKVVNKMLDLRVLKNF